ncbi:MAG: hypothetical protein ACE145_08685 [Terriglobia bacterium]
MSFRLPKMRNVFAVLRGGKKVEAQAGAQITKRDERFELGGSLIYRPTGGLTWYKGTIENLSRTGVLFRGEKAVPDRCPLEMSFTLPDGTPWIAGTNFFCWGKTVRSVMPAASDARPVLAVRILRYQSGAQPGPEIRFKSAA